MAHKSYQIDLDDREFKRKLRNLEQMTAHAEQVMRRNLRVKADLQMSGNPFSTLRFAPTAFQLPRIDTSADGAEVEKLRDKIRELEQAMNASTSANDANSRSLDPLMGKWARFLTAGAVAGFVTKVTQVRGEFQQLEIAFGTILNSGAKAEKLIGQLADTAAKTPFDLQGVTQGAKQLLAYGVKAEEVNDKLLMLGDIASGLSLPLSDLVYLYGTTMTQGRVYARDMLQFMGRGIPLAEELAKQFGVTKAKVGELVTAGKVGAKEFEQAMQSMRTTRFNNLMEEQSKSLTGQISNLQDALEMMLNDIGKASQGMISKGIEGVSYLVEHYKEVGAVLGTLIMVYGSARAAVIAYTVVMNIHSKGLLGYISTTRVATAAQALFNATLKANPIMLVVGAVLGLVAAYEIFKDRTTESEKAQKRLNEANERDLELLEERKSKAGQAVQTIKSETSTLLEQEQARTALNSLYPEIFKNMSTEEIKLLNATKLTKMLTEATEDMALAKKKAHLEELREQERAKRKTFEQSTSYGSVYAAKELEKVQAEIKAAEEDIARSERELATARMTPTEKRALQEQEVNRLLEQRQDLVARAKLRGTSTLKDQHELQKLDEQIKVASKSLRELDKAATLPTFGSEVAEARKKVRDLTLDLQKLRKGDWKLAEGETFAKLIEDKTKELNAAKSTLDSLLGTKSGGTKMKPSDNSAKLRKDFEESVRKQIESGAEALRQSALSGLDGIELIEAQYQTTLNNIAKLREEYITKHKATEVQANALVYDLQAQADEKRRRDVEKYYKSLLEKHATYEQQRRAVIEQSEKEIALFRSRGDEGNAQEAESKREEALTAIDLQFAMRSEEFQSWLDKVADMSLDALLQKLKEAQLALAGLKVSEELGQSASPEELARKRAELAELLKAIRNLKRSGSDAPRGFKEWQDMHRTLTDLTQGFDKLGQSVDGTLGSIIREAGAFSASVVGMIDGILTFANTSLEGIKLAASGTAKAIKIVEASTVVLAIISGALTVIQTVSRWFEKNTELSEEQKQAYQSLISSTRELTRANRELMKSLAPDELGAAYKRTRDLLRQGIDETRQMMSEWMESGSKAGFGVFGWGAKQSHGYDVVDRLAEEYKLLQKTLGRDIFAEGKIGAFADLKKLSIEEIEKLKQSPKLWAALGTEMQGYYNNILEMHKELAEADQERKDAITGTNLDAVTGEALEWITTLDDAMKTPAETFEKTMQGAIKRIIKSKYLVKEMQKWYDDFAKAGEDGTYTEAEIDALRKSYYSTTEAVRKKYEAMAKAIGSDALAGTESEDRHAEAKGIAQASQESVDENNALLNLQVMLVDKLSQSFSAYSHTALDLQSKGWQEVRAIRALTEQVESHTRSIDTNIKDMTTNGISVK